MTRTAQAVAKKLQEIYGKSFGEAKFEKYQLSWADLRGIAGVEKLKEDFVAEISEEMSADSFFLIPLSEFLLVGTEVDFAFERKLPGRLLEESLPDEGEAVAADEDDDLEED